LISNQDVEVMDEGFDVKYFSHRYDHGYVHDSRRPRAIRPRKGTWFMTICRQLKEPQRVRELVLEAMQQRGVYKRVGAFDFVVSGRWDFDSMDWANLHVQVVTIV